MLYFISFIGGVLCSAFLIAISTIYSNSTEWVLQTDDMKPHYGYYKCKECGHYSEKQYFYCPICGRCAIK